MSNRFLVLRNSYGYHSGPFESEDRANKEAERATREQAYLHSSSPRHYVVEITGYFEDKGVQYTSLKE